MLVGTQELIVEAGLIVALVLPEHAATRRGAAREGMAQEARGAPGRGPPRRLNDQVEAMDRPGHGDVQEAQELVGDLVVARLLQARKRRMALKQLLVSLARDGADGPFGIGPLGQDSRLRHEGIEVELGQDHGIELQSLGGMDRHDLDARRGGILDLFRPHQVDEIARPGALARIEGEAELDQLVQAPAIPVAVGLAGLRSKLGEETPVAFPGQARANAPRKSASARDFVRKGQVGELRER